ncbi:Hef nuclease [Campylobacter insulaenigrae]|nr:Hef nuclease [Campylobacter insulaenigrae]
MSANETTFEIILEKLKQANLNNRAKGYMFEKLSKHLLKEKDTANIYKNIYLWDEWDKKDGQDCGIDLVIQTNNDDYIAVQCKFYEGSKVDLKDLSTYFTKLQSGIGEIKFSKGVIISTSDLTQNAKKEIEQISTSIPIELITLEDFLNSNISWDKFDPSNALELPIIAKKKPREHQLQAINNTKEYFANKNNTRGKLIMACGTGKTFTSLKIIEEITPKNSIVLFLAPSIALVGQTFREYCKEKTDDFVASIVCSDSKSGKSIEDDIDILELPIPASTDTQSIKKAYDIAKKDNKRFIIFSTYQSVEKIMQAQKQNDLDEIDLIICDEAHRSVGNLYSGKEKDKLNTFTLCHSDENIKAKKEFT